MVNNAPAWSKNNWEYIYVYSVSGYPVLSVWGGWLAQYGLLLVAIPLVYLGRQVKSIISFKKELKLNNVQNNRSIALYVFLTDAFEIFLVMFFALAFLVFSWSEYYILVSLFFYIVGIKLLQKTIKKEML
ncbi:hypothetical protein ACUKBL_12445 [Furfurilactobacillus rossiae]